MKKYVALSLLLLSSIAFADITDDNYKHDYDRFTQTNSYFWKSKPKPVDTSDGIYAMIVGFVIEKSPEDNNFSNIFMFKHITGETYDFADCSNDWLVDGKILKPLEQVGIDDDELNDENSVLYNKFSEEQFKSIMQAKVAEYRICDNEFVVDEEQIAGLKHIYAEYLKK